MYSLANKISDKDIETLVAADRSYPGNEKFILTSFNAPKVIRSVFKRCYLSLSGFKPDITICDSWKSVAAVPDKSGKIIVLAHGQEFLNLERKIQRVRKALNRADLIIASSKMTAQLVKQVDADADVDVIYPTYMLDLPITANSSVTESLNIVSICRIEKRKGLLQSAKALAELRDQGYEFNWTIAGTGPIAQDLADFIASSSLLACTKMVGRISEEQKRELLNAANLFLMPSYQDGMSLEGFGISYIEAASYGIPAIAGAVGGAPEAVLDGITGWCVDGSDMSAIKHALVEALDDTEKRKSYGSASLQRFVQELSGACTSAKILELMSRLAETH